MEAAIPDKLLFKIGEVAAMTSLKATVLRFWETEFPQLKPKKSASGQRLYTKKDLELIYELKKLLYTEKLTIEGARKRIAGRIQLKTAESAQIPTASLNSLLADIKEELLSIRNML